MDKLQLYNVAKMYYVDGLGQQEIANITGYSRPQISRMLKEARSSRIVEITLHPPYGADPGVLARQMQERFGLQRAHVLDNSAYAEDDTEGRVRAAAGYAAEYLAELLPACRKVGVGWGHTIYTTVLATEYSSRPQQVLFVPLTGNSGFSKPYYQTNSIVDRFAEKYKARGEFINVPAFSPTAEVRRCLIESNGLDKPGSIWDNIDLAYFSLGGPPEGSDVIRDIPQEGAAETLLRSAAVGDVLGHYFDKYGNTLGAEVSERYLAMPLERLLQVKRRLCTALGKDKTAAIRAAISMGVITELITDHYTALALLKNEK